MSLRPSSAWAWAAARAEKTCDGLVVLGLVRQEWVWRGRRRHDRPRRGGVDRGEEDGGQDVVVPAITCQDGGLRRLLWLVVVVGL